jgi:tRNA threonylcarbamoyl adenosine modification protein (Sua5/YciO/YrdC/YwlC family)
MLLKVNTDNPQDRLLRQASLVLKEDGVLIYPTDTVYGLGCDLYSKRGIEKLQRIKPMEKTHRLSLLCADLRQLSYFAQLSDFAFNAIKRAVPGPYTFILPTTKQVSRTVVGKRGEAGFRIPDCRIVTALLHLHGNPILNTSVLSDTETVQDPETIYDEYRKRVDCLIDGGIVRNTPSTVIDLTGDELVIVRAGTGMEAIRR